MVVKFGDLQCVLKSAVWKCTLIDWLFVEFGDVDGKQQSAQWQHPFNYWIPQQSQPVLYVRKPHVRSDTKIHQWHVQVEFLLPLWKFPDWQYTVNDWASELHGDVFTSEQ